MILNLFLIICIYPLFCWGYLLFSQTPATIRHHQIANQLSEKNRKNHYYEKSATYVGLSSTPSDLPEYASPITELQDDYSGNDNIVNLANPWKKYKQSLSTSPLFAKMFASFLGFGFGDILAQLFFARSIKFNLLRLLRFALFGGIVHGPTGHFFYSRLNKIVPGYTLRSVTTKVLIDQIAWTPLISSLLIAFIGVIGGSTPKLILFKWKSDILLLVVGSWIIWPLAHFINFQIIPEKYRLLYINFIQLIHNIYLSVFINWPKSMFI